MTAEHYVQKIRKDIEHIHSGILYCKNDAHSTIIYANDYFYKMIGYTREEMEKVYNRGIRYTKLMKNLRIYIL